MAENETPIDDNATESEEIETPDTEQEDDDSDDSKGTRNSKELLTVETLSDLTDGDPLKNTVLSVFADLTDNVSVGQNAAKLNTESHAAALKAFQEENADAYDAWNKADQELQSQLYVLQERAKAHRAILDAETEKYRTVPNVDISMVNERHRAFRRTLFSFLSMAGVVDPDTLYRVPELPSSIKQSTGWSPRIGKDSTVNGQPIPHAGDFPTLTDLNKLVQLKGEAASGAEWANRFGTRDIPAVGLSYTLTHNSKTYRIVLMPRPAV